MEILNDAKKNCKPNPKYVLMDSFYPAAKLLKLIRKFKWYWITKIKSNRLANNIQIKELFSYRYGSQTGRLSQIVKTLVVKYNDNYWTTGDINLCSLEIKNYIENDKQ